MSHGPLDKNSSLTSHYGIIIETLNVEKIKMDKSIEIRTQVQLGFIPCKAKQPLRGMELEEKEISNK